MSDSILDRRWPWLVAAAAIVVAYLLSTGNQAEPGSGPADPRQVGTIDDLQQLHERDDVNVLFILIDTLRSDRLGSYGHERETSPFLDQMAATGVRFDRHLSQSSWTKASMASMWTGLNPWRAGITRFDHVLPEEAEMPAEILRDAGFRSIGLFRNGWVAPTFGFEQGFEVYNRPTPLGLKRGVLAKKPTLSKGGTDEDVTASAIEFLRVHSGGRWFLYLHLMDIHEYTYDEESALFGSHYSDVYDNSIRWTDTTIKVLIEHLVDQGYAENTIVVVASDHGEAFSERGFEGHGRQVFKESTEVPFFFWLPFKLGEPVVVESRSRNIDIWPTLFEILGVETSRPSDGRSLVPDIVAAATGTEAPAADRTGMAYLEMGWGKRNIEKQVTVSVADDSLRYVRTPIEVDLVEQLFDASLDPAELKNLSETEAATLARLRSIADEKLAEPPIFGEMPTREISEMELNQLRAIGYDIGQ
ncbi:MAG: sulfatase [Myxococcota bacterium]|jgi:arylsulfatase|nr:sulfatase [Myxococcota bacterium]